MFVGSTNVFSGGYDTMENEHRSEGPSLPRPDGSKTMINAWQEESNEISLNCQTLHDISTHNEYVENLREMLQKNLT